MVRRLKWGELFPLIVGMAVFAVLSCMVFVNFIDSCPNVMDARAERASRAAIAWQQDVYRRLGRYDPHGYTVSGGPMAPCVTAWELPPDRYAWTEGRSSYALSFSGGTRSYHLQWFDDTRPEDLRAMLEVREDYWLPTYKSRTAWILPIAWDSVTYTLEYVACMCGLA